MVPAAGHARADRAAPPPRAAARSRSCAAAPTSRRSRRRSPTRPTRCRAATSAGAPPARLPTLFLEAIEKLQPGDVSDILRSPNGFHIVKLLEKRGKAAAGGVQQTKVRHILLRAREGLSEAEARERLQRLRERIAGGHRLRRARARAFRGRVAPPRAATSGWVAPGDTVPEFERVMNALKDKRSEPAGPDAVRLAPDRRCMERRSDELSEDRKKLAARQAIRARKADEAYQDWLRQTRDRAFVENRLDER